jgi:nitrite reductase (NADH) small subunit
MGGDGAMDENWVEVGPSDAIAEGHAIEWVSAGHILAIFRDGGQLYAIDGMCAHQGGPLAEGRVDGGCVTCPWHGWQYELATGIQTINRQPLQSTYEVRERAGMVEVKLPSNDPCE